MPNLTKCLLLTLGVCALLLLQVSILFAQSRHPGADLNLRFEAFRLPGGNQGNSVQSIVQDSVGFLWFGSKNGLHRYDGQQFVTYRHDPQNNNSLAGNYIEWILIDRRGILWICHFGMGLTRFDPFTETCTRFQPDPKDPASLSNAMVSVAIEDRQGYIWVGTQNGLNRLDPQTGKFKRFFNDPNDPNSLSYNMVRALYIDKQGTLWVGCGFPWDNTDSRSYKGGLNRYQPQTESFTRFLHDTGNPASLTDNRVRALFEDSRGNFWVGTMGDGLHRMDRRTGKFTRLQDDPDLPSRPYLDRVPKSEQMFSQVTFVYEDRKNRLWIGAFNAGLNVFDPKNKRTWHFQREAGKPESPQNNFIWNICQSREGAVWIATGGGGGQVFKVNEAGDQFPFFDLAKFGRDGDHIRCFLEDSRGYLWLGVWGGAGLLKLDRKTGKISIVDPNPGNSTGTGTAFVSSLYEDRSGCIWASMRSGLNKINTRTGEIQRFRYNPDDPSSISNSEIGPVLEDKNGDFWIATKGGGLNRYNPRTGKFRAFQHNPSAPSSIGGNTVTELHIDKKGNVWAGGGGLQGPRLDLPLFLDRYDPATESFTHFIPAGNYGHTCDIMEDEMGCFWFNTEYYGLRKLDPATGIITQFTTFNSDIPEDEIKSMVRMPDGRIWMSVDEIIVLFDPARKSFFNYTAFQGVRLLEMGGSAAYCARDGEILIGGTGGFHHFYPANVAPSGNRRPPDIRLTGFNLLNEPAASGNLVTKSIWENAEIKLAHDQNSFTFHIACLDYIDPSANYLEFILENYDPRWRKDQLDGVVTYYNVPPGTYTFRVRGTNSEGVWNWQGAAIPVIIAPPWWYSNWAYALYALLISGLFYGLYRFQLNRHLAVAEALRLRELDEFKTKLYTNITHEFRTPLTLILGPVEKALKNSLPLETSGLEIVRRSGRQLLRLVNQMLDLSKMDAGSLKPHYFQGDVVPFIRYVLESFHSLAVNKNIPLHFHTESEQIMMSFDKEKLTAIVSNLLSNALKFTPEGGVVDVRITISGSGSGSIPEIGNRNPSIVIQVSDTGPGIPEEKLPRIFDRFYSGDESGGTGIGLALAKEMVILLGGSIAAENRADGGVAFTVRLPLVQSVFAPETNQVIGNFTPASASQIYYPDKHMPSAGDGGHELPQILIVEDNVDVARFIAGCLKNRYQSSFAVNGKQGVELALEQIPDLIISDVMMPETDGIEATRLLKNDERTSHIPVILLTARADLNSRLEGLQCGADAYLTKPFDEKELLTHIENLLELRRKLRAYYLNQGAITVPPQEDAIVAFENAFLQKVRAAMDAHLDEPDYSVEDLSRAVGMSHSQLHRKMVALTGYSTQKFVRNLRLCKAKELLRQTNLTVAEIAYQTGFSEPGYFTKVFAAEYGLTPTEWRK